MRISEYQQWIKESWGKSPKKGVTERDEWLFLLEEIGELAEALRARKGYKEVSEDLEKEFGDVVLAVATLAIRHDVDLEKGCIRTKESIIKRYG